MSGVRAPHIYINETTERKLEPFRQGRQIGWGCRLYALSAVLNHLYDSFAIIEKPLQARKRDEADAKSSLREISKKVLGLPVPEVVTDPSQLLFLATVHPEISACCLRPSSQDDFCNLLIAAVDNGMSPIVQFDVDPTSGNPVLAKGKNLHAAVVIGYNVEDGKLQFKLFHWQKEYSAIDAEALFLSTNQLPDYKTESKDSAAALQTFIKRYYSKSQEGGWYTPEFLQEFFKETDPQAEYKQNRTVDLSSGSGFRNTIILVNSIQRTYALIDKLNLDLGILASEVDTPQIRQKQQILAQLLKAVEASLSDRKAFVHTTEKAQEIDSLSPFLGGLVVEDDASSLSVPVNLPPASVASHPEDTALRERKTAAAIGQEEGAASLSIPSLEQPVLLNPLATHTVVTPSANPSPSPIVEGSATASQLLFSHPKDKPTDQSAEPDQTPKDTASASQTRKKDSF